MKKAVGDSGLCFSSGVLFSRSYLDIL